MTKDKFIAQVRGRLIVSCQALPDEPLHGADIMAKMALAAQIGGAAAIRANGTDDIRAIRAVADLPVIGLIKDGDEGVYITPTVEHAHAIIDAGAHVVAFDATDRPRPNNTTIAQIISAIHQRGGFALADVSTLVEGITAQDLGADFVAPTLSGYTPYSPQQDAPDFDLIRSLCTRLSVPILAEGRIHTPEDASRALHAGALAVVVGSAITRPRTITARFVNHIQNVDKT